MIKVSYYFNFLLRSKVHLTKAYFGSLLITPTCGKQTTAQYQDRPRTVPRQRTHIPMLSTSTMWSSEHPAVTRKPSRRRTTQTAQNQLATGSSRDTSSHRRLPPLIQRDTCPLAAGGTPGYITRGQPAVFSGTMHPHAPETLRRPSPDSTSRARSGLRRTPRRAPPPARRPKAPPRITPPGDAF